MTTPIGFLLAGMLAAAVPADRPTIPFPDALDAAAITQELEMRLTQMEAMVEMILANQNGDSSSELASNR